MPFGSKFKVQSRGIMGDRCSALWVLCGDMMYRKAGGLRAGEGVVVFPGTPICQWWCDRWGEGAVERRHSQQKETCHSVKGHVWMVWCGRCSWY